MQQTIKKIFESFIKTVGMRKFIFILFFGVFVSFITVLEPLIFIQIIKKVEIFYSAGTFDFEELIWYIGFWALFILFSIIIQYFYRYSLMSKSIMKNYVDLNKKYANVIINMPYGEYLGKKQGSLYKIFDRGCMGQERLLYLFFGEIIKDLTGIILIIILLMYFDVRMAVLVLSMLPFMVIINLLFFKRLIPDQRKLTNKWESIFGDIGNILSNFALTKNLVLEKNFLKSISSKLDYLYGKQTHLMKLWSFSYIYTGTLVMISRMLVLGFGVYFLIHGTLTLAMLFLFFSYIGWIYFPLGNIFMRLRDVSEYLTSIEKLHSEFDNVSLDEDTKKSKKIKFIEGYITFNNVSFGYLESKIVLKKINFKITPGEKIGFVGSTGAGKSTIINLLLRFWNINDGEIMIDNHNIKEINKKSLRSHIGVVSQDNSLFNLSIRENLLFANPKSTKKELESALNKANANFVFDLENGLDTVIGERGLKLSGGEKQRLSIARLFLQNPKILILDEATSALDNKTEKLIQKALDTLMKGRTSIIIAHRLSTIKHVDRIFVLEKGEIVESGSYDDLMEKEGKFYDLASVDHLILN
ncbi:ABC transporter ATP-binding protein [Candidatus Gracilibacteria bacterium 28_42_T64]|nr:ABC transporter ATP-binding protein [Candidatus Gracilibacteria bacterium 28_42_T64]